MPSSKNTLSDIKKTAAPLNSPAEMADALRDTKITRIRYYEWPWRSMVNQSANIVTIETNTGITGIGEGGTAFLTKQMAGLIIGQNPLNIERLWNTMYRGHFYPPGREKVHALGALDMALWDIKGKILGVPVWALLGGKSRDYIECYSTAFDAEEAPNSPIEDCAKRCIDYGYRAFRVSVADPRAGEPFNSNKAILDTYDMCAKIRNAIGSEADWCIDFHTRLDHPYSIRLASMLEDLAPFFIEDATRSEYPALYKHLRNKLNSPIAAGEHFGDKWDILDLIEQNLIDYNRISLPNTGGITEYMKIAAMCETHNIGQCPHFTGPIATAALVHANISYPGPVLMEMFGKDRPNMPHLPESYDLVEGKLYANDRPGLGVIFEPQHVKLVEEITEFEIGVPQLFRDDGSFTNW